uniref:Uncharacterized protein n=1 Tax=Arundo donax TaxID=35708 RepID=A0A0A9EPI5_ARUDO
MELPFALEIGLLSTSIEHDARVRLRWHGKSSSSITAGVKQALFEGEMDVPVSESSIICGTSGRHSMRTFSQFGCLP